MVINMNIRRHPSFSQLYWDIIDITLCTFKIYNVLVWYVLCVCVLQSDYSHSLGNTSISSRNYCLFFVVRPFKTYSLYWLSSIDYSVINCDHRACSLDPQNLLLLSLEVRTLWPASPHFSPHTHTHLAVSAVAFTQGTLLPFPVTAPALMNRVYCDWCLQ